MGVLRIDHPDVFEFIQAKRTKGRWNNFNVSVGVTDEFMRALKDGKDFALAHRVPPHSESGIPAATMTRNGETVHIYKVVKAQELWDTIMQSAYDYAEPGILFLDTINTNNNLNYCEAIHATNPCFAGDVRILTSKGYRKFEDCDVNPPTEVHTIAEGKEQTLPLSFIGETKRGTIPVVDVTTENGVTIRCTPDHEFQTETGLVQAKDLKGRKVLRAPALPDDGIQPTEEQLLIAEALGWLLGDGHFNQSKSGVEIYLNACAKRPEEVAYVANMCDRLHAHFGGKVRSVHEANSCVYHRLGSITTKAFLEKTGIEPTRVDTHYLPEYIWQASRREKIAFLKALFTADGSVQYTRKSKMVSFWTVSKQMAEDLVVLFNELGTWASLNVDKRTPSAMPDSNRQLKTYKCNTGYRLFLTGASAAWYAENVGFHLKYKWDLCSQLKNCRSYKDRTYVNIVDVQDAGVLDEVYCATQPDYNRISVKNLVSLQCGEQPLPPYGCCDLGPLILPKFVTGTPFTDSATFDWKAFKNAVALQVRALDNVLTLTRWPLKQQQEEAHNKRRIGVGFTGLGTTLLLLGIGYTSPSSYRFMQTLAETMRDAAYAASVELAKERGAFPLFDADKYLQAPFIKNLPQKLQKDIKRYGIRNSHLLSIAPTGTVSLAFADNCSNGIEPPFSWEYRRKKRNGDGTSTIYDVREHAYAVWREMHGDKPLPDYFKTALELSVQEHIKPMEIIQPYIDSAISKTVNVPADYPFEQFKDLYLEAYNRGLKGVATYRPNDTLGGVLLTAEPKKEPAPQTLASSVDSRVIEHRPSGPLSAISEKITYWTQEGKKVIYLIVSFMEHNGETRAIEFFLPVGHLHESQQWLTSSMRLLSLAARGGFLQSALENMRNTRWDMGPIRYGFYTKQDGTRVPRFHNSEVSLIAYAIEELVKRVKDSGLPLTASLLQAASSQTAKETPDVSLENVTQAPEVKAETAPASDSTHPMSFPSNASTCPECGAAAVVKRDGCSTCLNCGYVGACG